MRMAIGLVALWGSAITGCLGPTTPCGASDAGLGPPPDADLAASALVVAPLALDRPLAALAPDGLGDARPDPSAPAEVGCRTSAPAGSCDRCPTRACRQVRVTLAAEIDDDEWAMFCEEGDTVEEARIACLCAGGSPRACERSSYDTARALFVLQAVFGGAVPPVGMRYRDTKGLRAVVDQELHDWLDAVAGPDPVLRCDHPDTAAIASDYEIAAQRVRTTGHCR